MWSSLDGEERSGLSFRHNKYELIIRRPVGEVVESSVARMRLGFGGEVWAGTYIQESWAYGLHELTKGVGVAKKGRGPRPELWVNPALKDQGDEGEAAKDRGEVATGV